MITIVLYRPEISENIGFVARAMKNFGLSKLVIIEPQDDLDRARKTAKHAGEIIDNCIVKKGKISDLNYAVIVGTTSVLGSDYNIPRTPVEAEDFAANLPKDAALVFGPEGTGLTNEDIAMCDYIVSIPSSKKYPALNLSHAATILFYEIFKATGKDKLNSHIEPASATDKEVILEKLENIMGNLDFQTEEKKETQRIVWRRVLEKSLLSKREAFAILGLLSKLE